MCVSYLLKIKYRYWSWYCMQEGGGGISLLIDRTFPYLKTYFESVLIHEAYVS